MLVEVISDNVSFKFTVVRMAEWSKAPDSRLHSFLTNGTSGLLMEAWVQIPLLTHVYYL